MRTVEDIARILGDKEHKLHNIAMIWGFPSQEILREVSEAVSATYVSYVYISKNNPPSEEIELALEEAKENLDWVTAITLAAEVKVTKLSEQEPYKSKLAYYNQVFPRVKLQALGIIESSENK